MIFAAPVWLVPFFPSLDGPSHLANTFIFLNFNDPAAPIFSEFFEITWNAPPNLAIYLINSLFIPIVGPYTAEKLFVTCYLAGIGFGLRYALMAIGPKARTWALLGPPAGFNAILFLGFYNACASLVGFVFALGLWLRLRDRTGPSSFAIYFLAAAALYICHLSGFVMFALTVAVATLIGLAGSNAPWRTFLRRAVLPGCAFLPAAALAAWHLLQPREFQAFQLAPFEITWPDLLRFLQLILGPWFNIPFERSEAFVALPLVLGLNYALVYVIFRLGPRRALLAEWSAITLIFILIFLFLPNALVVRWLPLRILPFVYVIIILWLGWLTAQLALRERRIAGLIVALSVFAAGLVHVAVRPEAFARIIDLQQEFLEGSTVIAPNSSVLPLAMANELDSKPMAGMNIFFVAANRLTLEKPIVNLTNLQATTGFFPITYRRERNPFVHVANVLPDMRRPHHVDPEQFTMATGRTIDYVLVWGERKFFDGAASPPNSVLRARLAANYELVFVSPQRELLRVYRRSAPAINVQEK